MLKDKRIFIVEDDNLNRVVYSTILTKAGAWFSFDRWGRYTPIVLQQEKWDLLIMDLMLPDGVSGFDIYEEIRQIPNCKDIPIVAVSATEASIAIPKAQEMGFDGYISKPIDKDRFPEQLRQIIEGKKIWDIGT